MGLFILMMKSGLFLPCAEAHIYPFEKVLADIKAGVKASLAKKHTPIEVNFPMTAEFRFTRLEKACEIKANLEKVLKNGVEFGEDCHVITAKLENFKELEILLRGKL